jgi:hypothetical protein
VETPVEEMNEAAANDKKCICNCLPDDYLPIGPITLTESSATAQQSSLLDNRFLPGQKLAGRGGFVSGPSLDIIGMIMGGIWLPNYRIFS